MKRILFLLFVLISTTLHAQRERNYIYLLDCTKSMIGYNGSPNIWEPTKTYLRNELEKHTPGTSLHVIPFQGQALNSFDFNAEDFDNKKWKDIENRIDKIVQEITGTNICDAWDATDKYIDLYKDNYIILLTDGKDTKNGMSAVAKKLSDWCGKYPHTYAFYVQLTEAAIDQEIANVINVCDNEFVIDASKGIPVFGGFDNGLVVYANTLNLDKTHKIGFSSAGKYNAKAVCNDPFFNVKVVDNLINDGVVPIQIVAKQPLSLINSTIPQIYDFTFEIQSSEVNIINPTVKVQMTNKPERTLELLSEETDMGKAVWYDSFLFWGESTPDTLSIDLMSVFNDEAKKDNSIVEIHITDSEEKNDYKLFYNKEQVRDGAIMLKADNKTTSILSIVYNEDAKQGKRYLLVKPIAKNNLDKINDQPVEQYQLTLRSMYVVNWNPLKTILTWLGIIIITALLLWFLFIKHFIYPNIGVRTIQINDPYFARVKIKGKRRVVFTNKKMEQSILSRIFTGEILYKVHDVWSSPLTFEAGAKKKTLRVVRTKDYVFTPYSSTLKAPNDYVVENTNNNTKIKISIN